MPRSIDYSRKEDRQESLFMPFRSRDPSERETPVEVMWPKPTSFMSGRMHQFELRTANGISPYSNDLVDPVYDWLAENVSGGWNWMERESNHGHSVITLVWIEDPAEIPMFAERWSGVFELDQRCLDADLRARPEWLSTHEMTSLPTP